MEDLRAKKVKGPGGLREEAKKYGVKYASKMTKEELISLMNSSKYVNNGEEAFFDSKELIEIAKQAGISVTGKSKQRLISEVRFNKNDTADRVLREPSFYEDKPDEELVKDMFMQNKKDYAMYSLRNQLGHINYDAQRKVNCMEELFVRIRAGRDVKTLDTNVCGELRTDEDGNDYIVFQGKEMAIPKDSPYKKHVKCILDVFQIVEQSSNIILIDDREDWNKESLYSLISLLGCAMSKINKRYNNQELLSFLIILGVNTFLASVYGEKNVTHLDLRKRFYKACRNLGKQAFFINASRAKNSEKGKRLAKQMEDRDMYFERGIGWVSMYDDY